MEPTVALPNARTRLDSLLDDIAWGLVLILTGAIWLIPEERVPEGVWLLGVAAIILGANLVRYSGHVRVSGFALALGVVALLAGLARLWRHDLPLIAMLFILMGVSLVLKPLLRRHAPGEGR